MRHICSLAITNLRFVVFGVLPGLVLCVGFFGESVAEGLVVGPLLAQRQVEHGERGITRHELRHQLNE